MAAIFLHSNKFCREAARRVFRVSILVFIGLFIGECFLPGLVTNWFNPVWILIIAIISAIISQDND